ncbi:hypothetical protein CLIB1423_15S02212 [[Candida] railenensis]|uniref:Uncharacterized protein n=1 Tax=[Candida] railenensis TaxID=45579 RepID=A0A9P0QSP8_9ASCO|nr:hypothetical protein CLIB1423_15S02212 [[Candida] railenensis]
MTTELDLLSSFNTGDSSSKVTTSSAYKQRLSKDISRTEEFIRQADAAILKLEKGEDLQQQKESDILNTKKRVIAQYEAFSRLAYFPDKNDVIGTATAYSVTQSLVREQKEILSSWRSETRANKVESGYLQMILDDYQQLSGLIDSEIERKQERLEALDSKIGNLEKLRSSLSEDSDTLERRAAEKRSQSVDKLKLEARGADRKVSSYLKYIMIESSKNHGTDIDAGSQFIRQLVEGRTSQSDESAANSEVDGGWVESPPDGLNELIKILVLNDVVIQHELGDTVFYKLRDYGTIN